jgi:hypothetical protein
MSQAALIATVRRLHVICHQHGALPTMDRVPFSRADILRQSWGVQAALLQRAAMAQKRIGSVGLNGLVAALEEVSSIPSVRASLLGGLRLLPLGRFYRDGIDVYPAALATICGIDGEAA